MSNTDNKYYIDERIGKSGTVVRLVAYSRSAEDHSKFIATFECEYWRAIHSEVMTHRTLSRNASSSRAVNVDAMRDQAINNRAYPYSWGLNQAGMQSYKEHENPDECKFLWDHVANELVHHYDNLKKLGLHKQIVNRILEPVTKIKSVITATEFDNMFFLRLQKDVEPTMHELAVLMKDLLDSNEAEWLYAGQWHTPYVEHANIDDHFAYVIEGNEVDKETAIAVSTSCCAQVSYRKIDNTEEKATNIYNKLNIGTRKGHHSPTEHQATPMLCTCFDTEAGCGLLPPKYWEEGVTHIDRNGDFYSGNFKGFIQHRQLLHNNVCTDYDAATNMEE